MKFSIIAAFLAAGIFSSLAASETSDERPPLLPEDSDINVHVIGPLPYNELKEIVDAKRIRKRGNIGGVYLCEHANFGGDCYYGIYPLNVNIHPDQYWVERITAVGPDPGTECVFSNSNDCYGDTQVFTYPGGNLGSINDQLRCFKCWDLPIGTVFRRVPVETAVPKPQE